jgi:putrescine oxidase
MSEPVQRKVDVVVVGAGVAGLTAAWRLAQAGIDVAVLEARERVGGRLHTLEVDGEPFELGGQWIAPYQHAVRELIDEVGLELFQRHRGGDQVYVGRDGRPVRHGGHDAPMGAAADAAYDAAVAALATIVDTVDPETPWAHPDAPALDAMTFEHWLATQVDNEAARDLLRFLVASAFMTKPAHSFSVLQAAWLLSSAGGIDNLFDTDLVLDARVVGGAQRIPQALADRLGGRVHLGAPVTSCRWSAEHVVVEAAGVTVSARAAVIAVPPNLVPAIRFEPPLPGWRQQLDQWFSQGSIIKVQAAYAEPFWRAEGLSGTGFGPHQLVAEIYDNTPPAGAPGVIVGFISAAEADAASALARETRREAVLECFARYLGPQALDPTHYVERDWSTEEWTRGAYCASFGVGALVRFGDRMRRPIGPLRWACTDISGVGYMHMDGAVRSGTAAADSILAGAVGAPLAGA